MGDLRVALERIWPVAIAAAWLLLTGGCSRHGAGSDPLFESVPPSSSGIVFRNDLHPDRTYNILNNLYYYDGAGVAAVDVDRDGRTDLFFVGNEGRHALYRQTGDMIFEDVTEASGLGRTGGGAATSGPSSAPSSAPPASNPPASPPPASWSTGITVADVNGDGWPDLFLLRSAMMGLETPHALYINQGDGTFRDEAAERGLDLVTFGTHAAFVDIDRDGWLDLYLLNHSLHSEKSYGPSDQLRPIRDPRAGDRLFRNQGGRFTEISDEAGILSSALGYGLGVAVSDLDLDGWPDIYVGNDFHENDYVYVNQRDGTFREMASRWLPYATNSSMGNDIADLDGDLLPDIVSLDMMPPDRRTFLSSGGADPPLIARTKESFGYQIHAHHNTLHHHAGLDENGEPVFVELAMATGIAATDWSWAVLAADLTNNGFRDLFVTNGMVRRPNGLDFINALNRLPVSARSRSGAVTQAEYDLMLSMPPSRTPNAAFRNDGGLRFTEVAEAWGLSEPGFSSGAAWADLDGDGDLDLVVSDINGPARIHRNRSRELRPDSARYLRIRLEGNAPNTMAIGARVTIWHGDRTQTHEHHLSRGFQSSVEPVVHFGLGTDAWIDSIDVAWPGGGVTFLEGIRADTVITIREASKGAHASRASVFQPQASTGVRPFRRIESPLHPDMKHTENQFDPFAQEPLLLHDLSRLGPASAVADIDGDGLDDLFLGGSHQYPYRIFLQRGDGRGQGRMDGGHGRGDGGAGFILAETERGPGEGDSAGIAAEGARAGEDAGAAFFDADGDGDLDLYIARGGGQHPGRHPAKQDRLLVQTAPGRFTPSPASLPEMTGNASVVRPSRDGRFLFVGGRSEVWSSGTPPSSHLLMRVEVPPGLGAGAPTDRTDPGAPPQTGPGMPPPPRYADVTDAMLPELESIGWVTDAAWADLTGDGKDELILAGEWMTIEVFGFTGGGQSGSGSAFDPLSPPSARRLTAELGFSAHEGMWQSLHIMDVNRDGRPDLLTGNIGMNTRLSREVRDHHRKATDDAAVHLLTGDLNGTGIPTAMLVRKEGRRLHPMDPLDELAAEIPSIARQVKGYLHYSGLTIDDLLPDSLLEGSAMLALREVRSMLWLSLPDGMFQPHPLPLQFQAGPARAFASFDDPSGDGTWVIAAGNLPFIRPSLGAPQKSLPIQMARIRPCGPSSVCMDGVPASQSGLWSTELTGSVVTALHWIRTPPRTPDRMLLMASRHGDVPLFFEWDRENMRRWLDALDNTLPRPNP